MNTTTEQTAVLEMRHIITAPRERVFAAWTTPEEIQHWFGPATCRVQSARLDLRVGGEYCFDVFSQRIGETQIRGTYKEIVTPEHLVYTWQCGCDSDLAVEESLVTVDFIDLGPRQKSAFGTNCCQMIMFAKITNTVGLVRSKNWKSTWGLKNKTGFR